MALVVAKGLAYAISLAVGFRGGPIFPAVAIGVMVGVLASIALPDFALAPGVVAGLAGGAAASLKLPFFGALLAALLVGLTATGTAPIAMIAGGHGLARRVAAGPAGGVTDLRFARAQTARRAAPGLDRHGPTRPPLERARRHDSDLGPLPGAPRPPGLTRGRRRFGWGVLAASSLALGALIGLARPWPGQAIGLVLGFGAGALISAVSFELAEDGVKIAGGAAGRDRSRRGRTHVLRRVRARRGDGRRRRARSRCLPRRHTRADGARHRPGGRRHGEHRAARRDLRVEPSRGRRRRHRAEGGRAIQQAGAAALGRGGRGVRARDPAWATR